MAVLIVPTTLTIMVAIVTDVILMSDTFISSTSVVGTNLLPLLIFFVLFFAHIVRHDAML